MSSENSFKREAKSTTVKVIAAVILFVGLIVLIGQTVPATSAQLSIPTLVKVLLGLFVFAALGIVAIVVQANINQWILNNGGTDAQWLWFNKDPPGLEALRAADNK